MAGAAQASSAAMNGKTDPTGGASSGMTAAQAKASLDQALPGVKLQTKTTQTSDAAPSKPALSELLSQPKPALETPILPTTLAQGDAHAGPGKVTQEGHGQADALVQDALSLPASTPSPAAASGAEAAMAVTVPGAAGAVRVSATTALAETPAPATNPTVGTQVDGSIKWLLKNQDQGAELQLHPDSLGTVQIKLQVQGTEVHARIWASDPAALPVLQDHRASLEASLKQQGLNLGSFDLQQGRQETQTPAQSLPASTPLAPSSVQEIGQESPTPAPASLADAHRFEVVA